jgi:hypothetical protein
MPVIQSFFSGLAFCRVRVADQLQLGDRRFDQSRRDGASGRLSGGVLVARTCRIPPDKAVRPGFGPGPCPPRQRCGSSSGGPFRATCTAALTLHIVEGLSAGPVAGQINGRCLDHDRGAGRDFGAAGVQPRGDRDRRVGKRLL